jgi:hypothetical protein
MADQLRLAIALIVRSGLREVEAQVLEVYGPYDSPLLFAWPVHGLMEKCSPRALTACPSGG